MLLTRELLPGVLDLEQLQGQGRKLIGYVPNGYLPEELIYAAGAVPVPLLRWGCHWDFCSQPVRTLAVTGRLM